MRAGNNGCMAYESENAYIVRCIVSRARMVHGVWRVVQGVWCTVYRLRTQQRYHRRHSQSSITSTICFYLSLRTPFNKDGRKNEAMKAELPAKTVTRGHREMHTTIGLGQCSKK